MIYTKDLDLPYVELGENDNLYDNVDLEASDIVDARYWKRNGFVGNPDICALPRLSTAHELQVQNNVPLDYDEKKIAEMSISERKWKILGLRNVRFPFPFHSRIDQYLSSVMISSYSKRKIGITNHPERFDVGGETMNATFILGDTDITSNAIGFSIIGTAGTGKSTAFQMVSDKYPRAIRHNFAENSYVQIPIIRLTAFAGGNLSALYYMFARQLDGILDSSNSHYGQIRNVTNVGRMTELIISWIKRYHIGVIAIDEVQLMDFKSTSARSIENLLTITAMTGVALVMIGTEDTHWHGVLRLSRRTEGMVVKADEYCKQRALLKPIIKRLWRYQWLRKRADLTEDVLKALYDESMGSIDMLVLLWMTVQYEAVSSRNDPEINADYIRTISKMKFSHMQVLLKDSLVESEQKYLKERQSVLDAIQASAEADEQRKEIERLKIESERNIRDHYDRDLQMGFVINSIMGCYDYSEAMIRKAYSKAELEENFTKLSRRDATKRVLSYLKKPKRVTRPAAPVQEDKKDTGLAEKLLENLKENMRPIDQ